jgi:hypothetical protein
MNAVAGIGINLLVPLLGVISLVWLCRKMRRMLVQSPPFFTYFILFLTYGGWLMVVLTGLFWRWSGMASLGTFYLLLIAPLVTAAAAFSLRNRRTLSGFHRTAFIASIAHSGLMSMAFGGWLGVHLLAG